MLCAYLWKFCWTQLCKNHTVIFLMTSLHACSIQFDDVELTVDIWEIFGAWGSNGCTVFGGFIPKSKICRKCWNDNNLCLLCSVVVCVPAYVRAQSCCTENSVTTRGVKETRLVTGMEESTWKYYICDGFIAVFLQKATNKSAQKHRCDHIIRFTGKVYFRIINESNILCRLNANLCL